MSRDDQILAYVQSRLSPQDQALFEDDVANDPALRAEISALMAARGVFADNQEDVPPHGWARLSDRIDESSPQAANDNRPIRLSLLQVACVAVAAVLGWQVVEATVFLPDPAGYVTASTAAAGPSVQVAFAQGATLSDITAVLDNLEGQIIGGPSALGLFTVAFPDAALRDAAFSALSDQPTIAQEVLRN